MDSAKYGSLFEYLKNKVYPEGYTKQDKTTLQKFAKKFENDSKLESLFYPKYVWIQRKALHIMYGFLSCIVEFNQVKVSTVVLNPTE